MVMASRILSNILCSEMGCGWSHVSDQSRVPGDLILVCAHTLSRLIQNTHTHTHVHTLSDHKSTSSSPRALNADIMCTICELSTCRQHPHTPAASNLAAMRSLALSPAGAFVNVRVTYSHINTYIVFICWRICAGPVALPAHTNEYE